MIYWQQYDVLNLQSRVCKKYVDIFILRYTESCEIQYLKYTFHLFLWLRDNLQRISQFQTPIKTVIKLDGT